MASDRPSTKQTMVTIGLPVSPSSIVSPTMGIEVSRSLGDDATWDCWLRRDTAGRYSRFIHIRRVKMPSDVIVPIEALTGQTWDPSNTRYGSMYTPAGPGGFQPS